MKVVILAGGKGTRLSEYTKLIPKPLVRIGSKPILEHIIDYYVKFGFNNFIVAGGYKYTLIKDYFKKKNKKVDIEVINTGLNSFTAKRLVKLKKKLTSTFMLTYGDGISNVDLNKLLKFHKKNKKKITVTAVHPPSSRSRFGELEIFNNRVIKFKEKPNLEKTWINGGFFVVEPSFFNFIANDNVMLEQSPMINAVKSKNLAAFKHEGYWFCVDNIQDKKFLDEKINDKKFSDFIK